MTEFASSPLPIPSERELEFRSLDGLLLRGSLSDAGVRSPMVILLHGASTDRHEDGFFDELVGELVLSGASTFRFDLRGHGASEGNREVVTPTGILNDIQAAVDAVNHDRPTPPHLVGASFSGGFAAYFAGRRAAASLVLINPVLDYVARFLKEKPYFNGRTLDVRASGELNDQGWLDHLGVLRIGRAFINELPWIDPIGTASELLCPTLVFHGTADSRISHLTSVHWVAKVAQARLVLVQGADHELAEPGDSMHQHANTRRWHAETRQAIVRWVGSQARAT